MNTGYFRKSSGLTITGLAAAPLKINGTAEFAEASYPRTAARPLTVWAARQAQSRWQRSLVPVRM